MMSFDEITGMATEVAKANLGADNVLRAEATPAVTFEGDDALGVLIVMAPGVAENVDGDAVLETLHQIIERLQKTGDERFPILEWATEEELADVDSP
jgi:hypothetical protein